MLLFHEPSTFDSTLNGKIQFKLIANKRPDQIGPAGLRPPFKEDYHVSFSWPICSGVHPYNPVVALYLIDSLHATGNSLIMFISLCLSRYHFGEIFLGP
jgi:hypothetical protein